MTATKINTAWIDLTALGCIGLVTVGYILFAAKFAEWHVQFAFLDFPVFVSEFLLMFCGFLFLLKLTAQPIMINQWHLLIGLYFGFVLIKAYFGYVHSGPLALRNAALMYYPVFAIFGYTFFQKKYFNQKFNVILLLVICLIFLKRDYYEYYTLTLFVLALLLIATMKNRLAQGVLGVGTLAIVPYAYFYETARMMILAHLVFSGYIITVAYIVLKWPNKMKLIFAGLCMIIVTTAMVQFAGADRIKSIFDVGRLCTIFEEYDSKIREQKKGFSFSERKDVQIYHPEFPDVNVVEPQFGGGVFQNTKESTVQQKDTFLSDSNNSVFRLLIWRDMLDEYKQYHPIFGFDFGKPFRSVSLEVLKWAKSEWERDGWVAAHNSFFHMVYRSGIVGVIFIACVISLLFKMIKDFIAVRSFVGILLCGLILSWFVASNFLIVLEIPYTAIPIWSLYGLTFAYYQLEIKTEKV